MGQEFRAKPKKIAISYPDKQQGPFFQELTIIRPTVIFGERNRGNEYNLPRLSCGHIPAHWDEIQSKFHWGLLKQIASGKFLMVGKGTNYKSMAYVGNIAAFIKYHLQNNRPGYQVFNYIDKPDLNMNELVSQVEKSLNKNIPSTHFPYWLGMLGGLGCVIVFLLHTLMVSISSANSPANNSRLVQSVFTLWNKIGDFDAEHHSTG